MAGSHTLNGSVPAPRARYGADGKGRKVGLSIALAAGAFLMATPIVVSAVISQPVESAMPPTQDTALAAFAGRAVEVDGSVLAFRQQGDMINVTLTPSDLGQRVFVQNNLGDLIEFVASPGQSVVTAVLPEAFAASQELTIRVD